MIKVSNVTMNFRMANDRISSLKEFIFQYTKGKINYRIFPALQDVDFCIEKGEVVGIIGTNGAGKSTLLKIISGILTPTFGTVSVLGSIAPMLELGAGFDVDLSARENIYLNGAVLGYSKSFLEDKYESIVEFSELQDFMEVPVRNFSSGMVMRLAFSIATLVEPDILIIDEILAVGDGHFFNKSQKRMESLIGSGTTVILVSHSLEQIRSLCSRVIWLDKGKIKLDGEVGKICDEYKETVV